MNLKRAFRTRLTRAGLGTLVVAAVAYLVTALGAVPLFVPSHTWVPAGDMAQVRAGAAAVLLDDGRVLITGGLDADLHATATVERFSDSGSFASLPPMATPRAYHTATRLWDGRVLVVGGVDASGTALSSSEIYDPVNNFWAPAGTLNQARSGQTASLLDDGRVVIAGGEDAGTPLNSIELFHPITESFSLNAETLSSPRTRHASAALDNGRVLVTGGWDGSAVLTSTDIFNSLDGSVTPGPALGTARAAHTATRLLDGRVLLAGGHDGTVDLASAEVYDPTTATMTATENALATARRDHLALILPYNNSVLIVGGQSGTTALGAAELFVPWVGFVGAFGETGQPATPRAAAVASPLTADGAVLVAGGAGETSAELYGFATVKTDQVDYEPGTTVTMTGTGWVPGETVSLTLVEFPNHDTHGPYTAVADSAGNIVNTDFAPDWGDVGIRFYLTAVGSVSQAQTTFTDSPTITAASVSPSTVKPGDTLTGSLTVNYAEMNDAWGSAKWTISTGNGCEVPTNAPAMGGYSDMMASTVTDTITFTTPSLADGTYTPSFIAYPTSDCSGMDGSSSFNSSNTILIDGTAPTVALASPANGATIVTTSPTFSGTAGNASTTTTTSADSSTVTVKVYAGATATGSPVQTRAATRSGTSFSIAASPALAVGQYTAKAEQNDTAGNTGSSGANTFTITDTEYGTGSFTWDNGSTAKWSLVTGGPYTSVWTSGLKAILEGTAGTVSVAAGGATAQSLTFNTTGFTVGSNTLTLTSPATVATGSGISATIGSIVAGSAGLTKTGAGTLTLSGTNAYSGATALDNGDGSDAGILQISAASNLGSSTALNITNGRLYATASGISLGQTVTSNTPGGATIQIDSGTLTFTSGWSGAGALYKAGAGTMVMNGAYTATGKPNINEGTLQVGSSGSLSTTNMDVFSGGAFDFNGKNASFSSTVTLRGSGVGGGGALLNSAAATTSTLNGGAGITLSTNTSVGGAGNLVLPGVISGTRRLTKVGAGTLTLQGASTYSGNTVVSEGTVALSSAGSIASSPLIDIAGGAIYDVSAATAPTLGAGTLGSGQTLQASGSTTGGTLATAASHGLTLGASSPLSFTAFTPSGSGGAVPLTLSGAGTLTLGASSPVTVTVANGGTPLSAAGSPYKLIGKGASGTVATLPGGTLTVNGDGVNGTAALAITGGELYLVVTGPLDHFLVEAAGGGSIGTQAAGVPFNVKITAQDVVNQTVTSFTGAGNTVAITSNRTCSSGCATTATFTNGILASHAVTLTEAGTLSTVTATRTSGGAETGTSDTFTVDAGTATHLSFLQQPTTAKEGESLSPAVTVGVFDAFENLVVADGTTEVTLAIDTNPAGGTLTGGGATTVVGGVATFAGLSIDRYGAGYTLTASDTTAGGGIHPVTGDTSGTFTITVPDVQFSPRSVHFGPRLPGFTYTAPVTLTWNGAGSLNLSSIDVPANVNGFALDSEDCPASLATGESCTVTVSFMADSGFDFGVVYTGALIVTDDAPGSPHQVDLNGERTTWQPYSFNVGSVPVGATSVNKVLKFYNISTEAIETGASAVAFENGPFTLVSDTCSNRTGTADGSGTKEIVAYNSGNPTNPDAYCTATVTFSPTVVGEVYGTMTVTSITILDDKVYELLVRGTGTFALKMAPTGLNYGNVPVGPAGDVKTLTLTNPNGSDITLSNIDVAGTGFAQDGTTCGPTLAGGASCTVDVRFAPSGSGAGSGTVTVVSDADSNPVVALSGYGTNALKISRSSLSFGNVKAGVASAARVLTLINQNSGAITLGTIASDLADYAVTGGTCGATVPGNGSCTLEVTFTPAAGGERDATLSIASDATGSPHTVGLYGYSTFAMKLSASNLSYGTVKAGVPKVKTLTLTNVNGIPIHVTGVVDDSADYAVTGGTCDPVPFDVPASGSCTLDVTFTPAGSGESDGMLTVTSDADDSPHATALYGYGTLTLKVSASNLSYATVKAGTPKVKTLTLTNVNGTPVHVSSVGDDSADYVVTGGTCGAAPFDVPATGNCTIEMTFTPAASGESDGTLTITSNADYSPHAVGLYGYGSLVLKVSRSDLNFGNTPMGTPKVKTLTLTNVNGVPIHVSGLSAGGDFAVTGGTCFPTPSEVPAAGTCTVEVTYTPSTPGATDNALTITTDADYSPHVVLLYGYGT